MDIVLIEPNDYLILDDVHWKVFSTITDTSSSKWEEAEEERRKRELREWREAPY